MKVLAKMLDFLWGVLLAGTLPMLAFCLGLIFIGQVRPNFEGGWFHMYFIALGFVMTLVVSLGTLYFICRWRMRHRLLPISTLPVEVALGLVLSAVFFMFVLGW